MHFDCFQLINQRLEKKKLVQYDETIKSAGRLFLQIYRSLQEGEQKYRRENEGKTDESKSLRTDGLNHLKNGLEGFLVKDILDIKGLNKEDINNIKQLCNEEGLRGTIQAIDRWLERNGHRGSYYSRNSLDTKDKASNTNNAGLDKQALGREARRGQSSQNSQADFSGGQIKTGYDDTNHPIYMYAEAVKEFIDSMSDNDLRDEQSLIKQEYADMTLWAYFEFSLTNLVIHAVELMITIKSFDILLIILHFFILLLTFCLIQS